MHLLGNRRNLLRAAGALAITAAADAILIEPRWLQVTHHDVPILRLPRELAGFQIAQITDAHLTAFGRAEAAIVEVLQSSAVQLITLTGDIIDSPRQLGVLKQFCAALRKPGTALVATLGNWEHWGKVPLAVLRHTYRDLGITLLVNESLVLRDGVTVSATDDFTAGAPSLRDVLVTDASQVRILLTHSPQLLDTISVLDNTFGLTLAGHTHGGQVRVTEHFAPVRPPGSGRFVSGWYDTPAGRAYVSRGTGTSIVPVRFACRPELPLFKLCPA